MEGTKGYSVKGVILVGGPSQCQEFRPLSIDLPPPLLPVGGPEMIFHHVEALNKLRCLTEVLIIGHYDSRVFRKFMHSAQRHLTCDIRYLQEPKPLGTAGGIKLFKDEILKDNPDAVFVIHGDIFSLFPLNDLLQFHVRCSNPCSLLGTRVSVQDARSYGCLVMNGNSGEIVHWAEKPETFISNLVNCGIYLFSAEMISHIHNVGTSIWNEKREVLDCSEVGKDAIPLLAPQKKSVDILRMEKDVLRPLAGKRKLYMYESTEPWRKITSPEVIVSCSGLYLQHLRLTTFTILAMNGGKNAPLIVGNVIIDRTATVHPTAKIGPNVIIKAGCTIGAGVRIAQSIVLEGADIRDRACVLYSIIGWNSVIGQWSRIEGNSPEYRQQGPSSYHTGGSQTNKRLTILGVSVTVQPELCVRNSIVMPNSQISDCVDGQIIL